MHKYKQNKDFKKQTDFPVLIIDVTKLDFVEDALVYQQMISFPFTFLFHTYHSPLCDCFTVKPVYYGSYSSFCPTYDSTFANLSKEESEMVYATYGNETAVQYAKR